MITLTYKQLVWLDNRNRNECDVLIDDKGMFIEMLGWSQHFKDIPVIRRVYLPQKYNARIKRKEN